MKTSWLTNMLLVITAVLLAMIFIQRYGTDSTVYAQSGAKFGYVQTGTSPALTEAAATVIDLRNGNCGFAAPESVNLTAVFRWSN